MIGSKINPEIISLFDFKAIEIAKCGIPCKKFIVPSIGSIIQKFLSSLFISIPLSSLIIEKFGLAFFNSEIINLNYIRAAIEAKTGKRLKLTEIRRLLVEEGLITASEAKKYAPIFNDYREYFRTEDFSVDDLPKSERDF